MLPITLSGMNMSQPLGDLLRWMSSGRPRLDVHEDAKDFWTDLYYLRKYPDLDEKGQEALRLSSN